MFFFLNSSKHKDTAPSLEFDSRLSLAPSIEPGSIISFSTFVWLFPKVSAFSKGQPSLPPASSVCLPFFVVLL